MGEFYHLKKSALRLSIACQRGFEPIKGIGEADSGQWVVKIPRADSSQQWKTAFHSGMSTSLKRGYEASMRNLKSAITYEIWRKKTAYHTERAGDKWLHWHQPSTNSPSYQRQSKYQLSWQERALWWKLLVHLLRSLLSFLYIYIRLFWSRTVGSPPSTVCINQGQLQTETFFKFCWDIAYSLYIINDLSDYHNWEEFVLAPTWNIHYTLSWLHL